MNKHSKIKEYWENRAEQYLTNPAATTDDIFLRELEINTLIQTFNEIIIQKKAMILDVGCGDSYSTLKLARTFPDLNFLGIDYSDGMIKLAKERKELCNINNIELKVGDVTNLTKCCNNSFDVIISDRCLINLNSSISQKKAISEIANHVIPGGYYIAIENFIEGHENMNAARKSVGLPEIPVRWHNLYFKENEFIHNVERMFDIIVFKDFSSSYYFATRVIYSAMCQMKNELPDYSHEIHRLSIGLPWAGQFSPIRMIVMRKRI